MPGMTPPSAPRPVAIVTGASSGIGAATARRLAADGFHVVVGARRLDRLTALATEVGGTALELDVTDADSVAAFADGVGEVALRSASPVRVLVNNAGGARGLEPVAAADLEAWRWMYEVNVLGVARVTKAFLPALEASGNGHVVVMSSTAGHITYEGGAGYTAAKHGVTAVAETLRLELAGRPVRVTEIAPGMVKTEEFSLRRFDGDPSKADEVYAGVTEPLTADDIADIVSWCVTRPRHVNVDLLVVRPLAQAAQYKVHRGPIWP
jgi:NADP-dependent 3-hydroxy acid dehydrogenase YdfG